MATSTIFNLQEQQLLPSLDARLLREEARQRIEELAGKNWTDYNTHDPGITILEVLAYAITDLGLRSRLDIADLLSSGKEKQDFFTARQVLPSAPYTPDDYRRLLLNHREVRNAWIERRFGGIKGFYSLLIELEPEPLDLSIVWLKGQTITTTANNAYEFYAVFPHWESLSEEQRMAWEREGNDNTLSTVEITNMVLLDDSEKDTFDEYAVEGNFTFGMEQALMTFRIRLSNGIPKKKDDGTPNVEEESEFREALFGQLNANADFFRPHQTRARGRAGRLRTVKEFVLQHRNLCEDWEDVRTTRVQQIGLRIEALELQPEADPEKLLARIYFLISQFIDPNIRPQTCEELLADGKTAAEIFEGPLLEKGFLSQESLEIAEQKDKIYTSDLIRLIMQQPEVIGVSGLKLDLYLDRVKSAAGVVQCLKLLWPHLYKPKLSFDDSYIQAFKRGAPVEVDAERVKEHWEYLKEEISNTSIDESDCGLPIPTGDSKLGIATFYSIQNDFPEVYGLREGEVVQSAPPLRHAQAKQLKAYLLFFEQLLNNYCEQLANVQALFSMRNDADRTYFFQPLYDVPAVRNLYTAFLDEQQLGTDGGGQPAPISWEEFKQNCNQYIKGLDWATENRDAFLKRRNGFIDHMLARFAEHFTDYAAWAYVHHGGTVSPDLVFDKLSFLQRFPELSSRRAVAFAYTATRPGDNGNEVSDVWDTENVSGFEKKVAAQLGMPDFRRRSLAEVFDINNYVTEEDGQTRFWNAPVSQVNENPDQFEVLLYSGNPYTQTPISASEVAALGQHAKNFKVLPVSQPRLPSCRYYFSLLKDGATIAGLPDNYPSNRAEPETSIRKVIHLMQGRQTEGMHFIEHILLRPMEGASEALAPISFQVENGAGDPVAVALINDPYSFQVSIFLPGWTRRFKDPGFRAVAERRLREELPAYIYPWIFWVELKDDAVPVEFTAFEAAFQIWLENINGPGRAAAQNELIVKMNALVRSDHVTLANTYQPFELEN